jgi:hypothetical protein
MDITRNHYFLAGLVLIAVGLQFHWVDSYVLTKNLSAILAEQPGVSPAAIGTGQQSWFGAPASTGNRIWHPPEWLGGILLCVGAVFTFHALALSKPAG